MLKCYSKDMIDYKDLQQYILDNYEEVHLNFLSEMFDGYASKPVCAAKENLIIELDESFSNTVLRLIDERNLKDSDVYNSINMDRRLFSKMRNDNYNPSKQTAIAICIALKLNLDETNDLLEKAGYTLSHSNKADVIIEYFIKNKIYDLYTIDEALLHYDQKPLGKY